MRKSDIKRFRDIVNYEKEYGYIALNDYHDYYKFKCLDKIHVLKRLNKKLSGQRKAIEETLLRREQKGLLCPSIILELNALSCKVSEQIGRNSNKIQRMRSSYKQMSAKASKMYSNRRALEQNDICF